MVVPDRKKEADELFRKAYQLQMSGMMDEAIKTYERSIELHATAEAYTFLGWTHSFKRHYEEAIRLCHEAIKVDPDFGNPYNDIGAYLIELERFDEAIPWFEKAISAKRYESYCYPHYNMGRVYEKKGDWSKAMQGYQDSLTENADYELARRAINRIQALLN